MNRTGAARGAALPCSRQTLPTIRPAARDGGRANGRAAGPCEAGVASAGRVQGECTGRRGGCVKVASVAVCQARTHANGLVRGGSQVLGPSSSSRFGRRHSSQELVVDRRRLVLGVGHDCCCCCLGHSHVQRASVGVLVLVVHAAPNHQVSGGTCPGAHGGRGEPAEVGQPLHQRQLAAGDHGRGSAAPATGQNSPRRSPAQPAPSSAGATGRPAVTVAVGCIRPDVVSVVISAVLLVHGLVA